MLGKKKASPDQVVEQEEINFDDVVGQKTLLEVDGMLDDGQWEIRAKMSMKMTLDGLIWVSSEIPILTYAKTYQNGVDTAMIAFMNGAKRIEFFKELRANLDDPNKPDNLELIAVPSE